MTKINTPYAEERPEQKRGAAPDPQQREGYSMHPAYAEHSVSTLEGRVKQILRRLGVPVHMKGYPYLKSAILRVIENPDALYLMTKDIYPSVAKEYGSTTLSVERSIRYAIEASWVRGGATEWNIMNGFPLWKVTPYPKNSEFIAMIVEYLLEHTDSAE